MTGIATSVDAARVELLLNELRLPGVKAIWPKLAAQSDKEGWPAARFLAALAEHEAADRTRRRIERHMVEARLPAGKTLATFDFESVPMLSKAQAMALAAGDAWLKAGANLSCSVHRAAARPISARRSAWLSSRTVGAFSSREPLIWCNGCRSRGASWRWSPRSPNSIAMTS
ncbi:hypothetical protein ACVIHI_000181 [Bradyrhizobium sp. USDA 4524]|nr:hypothetical protein [Bradyrhizobium sp. USDA 4538]MCP1899016.1 hypothetical protein [Bradyrhizobium sp. USDA 4537]MCP1986870.1 hypothetical protein [Bradyrhizobium sp. USDA 4539]